MVLYVYCSHKCRDKTWEFRTTVDNALYPNETELFVTDRILQQNIEVKTMETI